MHEISGHTRLGCLLGSPVSHSISPLMYNESFRLLGLDYVYLCFDTKDARLSDIVPALRQMNVFGFNLTMPDKERILEYLDDLTPAAQLIGAVNTVSSENGRLIGHNTDGIGYMRSLQDVGYQISCGPMTLLGAGGAASSIAIQAALDGVPALHIANRRGRSWANANRLADTINRNTSCKADVIDLNDASALRTCLQDSTLLTNATSIGMTPDSDHTPVSDISCFHPDLLVSDIIYDPRTTRLLEEASRCGCRTVNGLYMLLYQGEAAFQIWTGRSMPTETIRRKFFQ